MRRTLFTILGLLIMTTACQTEEEETSLTPEEINFELEEDAGFRIDTVSMPSGDVLQGDDTSAEITGQWLDEPQTVWIGESLRDPLGNWIDFPAYEQRPEDGEDNAFTIQTPPAFDESPAVSGPYTHVLSIWDQDPSQDGAVRLMRAETNEALTYFNQRERFSDWPDTAGWYAADHAIGQTSFEPGQVSFDDGQNRLLIHKDSGIGGEIRTEERFSYGSYQIAMRVPDHPGTLTGFFFYETPDFHHEIDIEVMNNPSGEVWFTTYQGGQERHASKETYDFDPTDGVHIYRIDYFPDYVAFFINGEEHARFEDGYSHEPMQLMVNYWEPTWLRGARDMDQGTLYIESIMY
ncbi:glycoside hydrolase family 16 protein [Salisediminibacterium selenitireducens]|uniref:Beta-glucanase n=1 Tax=Bacillus selenitireducens (strain ATCC 700615 / DSM 15326 / MLS10) TaxID=439292 RepID=D6XZR4_BACIE|nr:glycoside hydrolase family 16 protein [Salisediminibacterium selenitireducens]ADI00416.1 glycoside hydrolase family 16 [[Bacillus] selenitireducens MLS10]